MHPKYSEIYLLICTFYSIVTGKINGIYVCSATIILKYVRVHKELKLFLKFHRGINQSYLLLNQLDRSEFVGRICSLGSDSTSSSCPSICPSGTQSYPGRHFMALSPNCPIFQIPSSTYISKRQVLCLIQCCVLTIKGTTE